MSHMPYNDTEADGLDTHHPTESRLADHIARVDTYLAEREKAKVANLGTYTHSPVNCEETREE